MSDCGCPEPKPELCVARWKAWFEGDRTFEGQTLADWAKLPDDGMFGLLLFYEKESSKRFVAGNNWYWALPGPRDTIYAHGDEPRKEIEKRYPGAIIKRGKWTDDVTMGMVTEQMAAA